MRVLIVVLAAAAALVVHERLVRRPGGRGRLFARWALLGFMLAAAALAGPAIRSRLATLLSQPGTSPPVAFDPAGDPYGVNALAAQRPEDPFPSGGDPAAVADWQNRIRAALLERQHLELAASAAPRQAPLEVLSTHAAGPITRTLVRYTSWDGTRIPAYVLDPGGSSPKPAVLVVPGHGVGIAATAGFEDEYQHQAGMALARRGYLVLTPELRGFGMLARDGRPAHRLVSASALAAGTSYKAIVARDLRLALSVLENWQGADRGRIAVVGTSLGGELAVLLAAVDPRVKVTVANSYGGVPGPAVEDDDANDQSEQTPHGCHTMPGINRVLLHEDWVRLVAPRPVLIVRGSRNVPPPAARYERLVREAYRASGAADRFEFRVEPGAHEFYLDPTADYLRRWL